MLKTPLWSALLAVFVAPTRSQDSDYGFSLPVTISGGAPVFH